MRKTALQNKLTLKNYSSKWETNSQVTSDFIKFYAVLELFEANSETTAKNQEVKRSLYSLQNLNNLPKDYIRVCLTCQSLAELFNFIGLAALQEYI